MELIDRRKLVSDFWQGVEEGSILSYEDTDNLMENAPTVDAVEVVLGRIIQTIENGKMKRVFSCCNTDFTQLTMWITPNYCPNCGARIAFIGMKQKVSV